MKLNDASLDNIIRLNAFEPQGATSSKTDSLSNSTDHLLTINSSRNLGLRSLDD